MTLFLLQLQYTIIGRRIMFDLKELNIVFSFFLSLKNYQMYQFKDI